MSAQSTHANQVINLAKFYEAYTYNKNSFFAPGVKKSRSPSPNLHGPTGPWANCPLILRSIITSNSRTSRDKGRASPSKDLITPASLSLHIQKRAQACTPDPNSDLKFNISRKTRFYAISTKSKVYRSRGLNKRNKSIYNSNDEDFLTINLPNLYSTSKNAEVQT